mgnify:CR=1 FL=1|tara:strand:+ start:525 stop:1238 length:714 start_codon:yes stop_codon:yes gene_type:complete
MKLSIAIPTWESYGRGVEFINDLLRTIEIQTFKDFEVCISDHSLNDEVMNEVKQFEDKFEIVYVKNSENYRNGPSNTNKAISMCSGDIIKVMFQDDFFYDDEALEKIYNELESSDKFWLVNGSNHTNNDGNSFYWDLHPHWNPDIINGRNTISSPSVLSAKKELFDQIGFDKSLIMMMDCEFYFHAKKKFGDPIYYDDILVSNRVHSEQISSLYNESLNSGDKLKSEVIYCIDKHSK